MSTNPVRVITREQSDRKPSPCHYPWAERPKNLPYGCCFYWRDSSLRSEWQSGVLVLLLCSCHSEERSDRRISLTITATTGEILRYAQNDRVVFWFCFYVLVILRSEATEESPLRLLPLPARFFATLRMTASVFMLHFYWRDSSLRSEWQCSIFVSAS